MVDRIMNEISNKGKNNIRVLIVDDTLRVRRELVTILKLAAQASPQKIEVVGEAQDGLEAIQQAETLHPDVVIMDLEMPGMDGYTATQFIKSAHPSIQIIVLSIHSEDSSRLKAAQVGADTFIEKGTPIGEVLLSIQRLGGRP